MTDDVEVREAKVSYTTKELLQRIDDRFERLEGIAQGMARHEDVERVEVKVDAHTVRLDALEKEANEVRVVADALSENSSTDSNRKWKWYGGLALFITTFLNVMALGPDVIPHLF